MLLTSTVGFGVAAVFTTDPITAASATTHGAIHSMAALLGGNISGAAFLLGWSLARNQAWASARGALRWTTGMAFIGFVTSMVMSAMAAQAHGKFGPTVLVGWLNRILIVAYAAWMMALAWRVIRLRRPTKPHVSALVDLNTELEATGMTSMLDELLELAGKGRK